MPLRVNFENVVKQGLLYKRGNLLKMYSNQYHFYLEKRDEIKGTGPYLKYGRKGKNVSYVIDLSFKNVEGTDAENGIMALREHDSRTKFRVITSK